MSVLVLGGTAEARELATVLDGEGVAVVTSLAGRVAEPLRPPGAVRVGGFGGAAGLARWIAEHGVERVIDATHPFATRISASAEQACAMTGVALERVARPGYVERPGDDWRWVDDLAGAAAVVAALGRERRVLLTTGRLGLGAFAAVDVRMLVRCISAPAEPLPPRAEVLLARGPFTLAGELALIDHHAIDMIVTKDSGGPAPKLEAARARGLPVVVVRRPAP